MRDGWSERHAGDEPSHRHHRPADPLCPLQGCATRCPLSARVHPIISGAELTGRFGHVLSKLGERMEVLASSRIRGKFALGSDTRSNSAAGYGEGDLRLMGSLVDVELTRGELVALKETIELTPLFKGRSSTRDAIRALLRSSRPSSPLSLDEETVTCLARNVVVPVDLMSANIHSKLNRAIERQRPATAAL